MKKKSKRPRRKELCLFGCGFECTLPLGHAGDHKCHGIDGQVVWTYPKNATAKQAARSVMVF